MLAATRCDNPQFDQSLIFLWAQLQNDHLDKSLYPKLRTSLDAVAQEYAQGRHFNTIKETQNLVCCVLSNLQLGFSLEETHCTDCKLTLQIAIQSRLPQGRFSWIADSLFKAIATNNSSKKWHMTHREISSTHPLSHELTFVR